MPHKRFQKFPKVTKDSWRLPEPTKKDLKMFWSYTNRFNVQLKGHDVLACRTGRLVGSSAIHEWAHKVWEQARSMRREKSICSHHCLCSTAPLKWLAWKNEREQNNLIYWRDKMSQVTNLQMHTWCKTVNRHEHLNLAKFKSCGAERNKGGINPNIKLRRRKARTNSGCKKCNFDDTEQISKILEINILAVKR